MTLLPPSVGDPRLDHTSVPLAVECRESVQEHLELKHLQYCLLIRSIPSMLTLLTD